MSHVHAFSMRMYFFSHILTIVNCFGTFLIVSFSLPFFLFTLAAFCERPFIWGEYQFTPCRPFAKGTRFMNKVMTFVLHPLSHYNSITEPHARFLLSLLKHFTTDFPSHFILSIIDVHLDSVSVISSSFLLLSRGSYTTFLLLFPYPTTSLSCVP